MVLSRILILLACVGTLCAGTPAQESAKSAAEWIGTAFAAARDNREADALAALRNAVAAEPNDERSHLMLAACLARSGARDEAVAECGRALSARPDSDVAKQILELIQASAHVSLDRVVIAEHLDLLQGALRLYNSRNPALEGTSLNPLKGPFLVEVPRDPWGRDYVLDASIGVVLTYGADGKPGGEREDADVLRRYLRDLRIWRVTLTGAWGVPQLGTSLHVTFPKGVTVTSPEGLLKDLVLVTDSRKLGLGISLDGSVSTPGLGWGGAVWAYDPATSDPGRGPRLQGLLAELGIDWTPNVVIQGDPDLVLDDSPFNTIAIPRPHAITNDFMRRSRFVRIDQATRLNPSAPSPARPGMTKILELSEDAWGEYDLESLQAGKARFDEARDGRGPVPLGWAIEIRAAGSPIPGPGEGRGDRRSSSRVVAIGDSDFASTRLRGAASDSPNADLFLDAIAWLAFAEEKSVEF